jgi:hypothetical protein
MTTRRTDLGVGEVRLSSGKVDDGGSGLEMCVGGDGSDKRSRSSSIWSGRLLGSPWCSRKTN